MSRAFAIALGVLAFASPARAEGLFLTDQAAAQKLFPEATRVVSDQVNLTDAEADAVSHLFGYRIEQRSYRELTVFDSGGVRGTVFVLDVLGQNAPITFGVGITRDGVIRGVEVMAYRESRGEEIRNPRFLRQLQGKSITDKIALGVDVDAITGATISSRSATFAARKALALASVLHARAVAQSSLPRPAAGAPQR